MSREKALKRINEYLAKQEPQKVELASAREIPKYENLEDIQREEKLKRFLNETVSKAQEIAIDEWEDGLIDVNVMSDEEFRQQKFLNDLQKKINQ